MRMRSFSRKKSLANTKNRGLARHGFSAKSNSFMMTSMPVHLDTILQVMIEEELQKY